ncbi:MAG TPA: hypothetical protein VLF18_07285 [Tahibacter sp.]|uniref:hypothetical protein n=1 Tax=Tahibacter sp. TaxID=2056211 RepID=UPI002CB18857|nr:hypothetical protein [Tahibacter sp.]HSX59983.1 hypothetical protein [Tahibacter sp.]
MRPTPPRLVVAVVAVAAFAFSAASAAGPLNWVREKLGGKPEAPKAGVVTAQPGAITLLLDQPTRLPVDATAPEAELPRGRSYFRRVELSKPVDEALIEVRVIAQDSDTTKHRTVFKPLFYLLDDEGNVRETVAVDPLKIDIRPFQPTALVGCVKVSKLNRFLVATTDKDVGKSYESRSRSSVNAPSKGGFYYSTDAVNVKLPYAATGELVLTVSAPSAKRCEPTTAEAGKDGKKDGKDKTAETQRAAAT